MKILTSDQIKRADIHTIEKLKITSIDLMENAAMACSNWIRNRYLTSRKFIFLCGNGNNGGDGLAIARIISKFGYSCSCFEYSISLLSLAAKKSFSIKPTVWLKSVFRIPAPEKEKIHSRTPCTHALSGCSPHLFLLTGVHYENNGLYL